MSSAVSGRSAAGRGGRRYRNAEQGQMETGGYRGNHFCNANLVDPMRLAWTKKRGEFANTTFRIMPGFNPEFDPQAEVSAENPVFDPFLIDYDGRPDIGDHLRIYWAVRGLGGNDPVTFLIFDPAEEDHSQDWVMKETPAGLLWLGLAKAIKRKEERPGWAGLKDGSDDAGAVLVKPKKIGFVQALLFEHGSKLHEPPKGLAVDDRIPLIDLSSDGARQLQKLMRRELTPEQMEEFNVDQDDPIQCLEIGHDPVDFNDGVFFRFFPVGHDPRQARQQTAPGRRAMSMGGPRGDSQQEQAERFGYECYHLEDFNGISAAIPADVQEALEQKIKPWEDVFIFKSIEEQARLCSQRLPFDLVQYCWSDFSEWIPSRDSDEARAGRRAVSAPVGELPDGGRNLAVGTARPRRQMSAAPAEPESQPDDEPAPVEEAPAVRGRRQAAPAEAPTTTPTGRRRVDTSPAPEAEAAPAATAAPVRGRRQATPDAAPAAAPRGRRSPAADVTAPEEIPDDAEAQDNESTASRLKRARAKLTRRRE